MVALLIYDQADSIVGYLVFPVYSQEISVCKHKKTIVYIQCKVGSQIGQVRASMH